MGLWFMSHPNKLLLSNGIWPLLCDVVTVLQDQSALTADIQAFWTHTFSFSIEVRGQANEMATLLPTVLLEKWTMKITSKK